MKVSGKTPGIVTLELSQEDHTELVNLVKRERDAILRWIQATGNSSRDQHLVRLDNLIKEVE